MATQILIADDHFLFRQGLKHLLMDEFPDALIEEAESGQALIKKTRMKKWSIVISDLSMPGISGLEMIKQIKSEFPDLPLLILSMHPENQYALRVLKSGASGYITKESAASELIRAVHQIISGRKYVSEFVAEAIIENIGSLSPGSPHEALSNREFEVFKLIASGKTVTQIAVLLSLSIPTISTYRKRIIEKTNLKNNAEITLYAITNGIT